MSDTAPAGQFCAHLHVEWHTREEPTYTIGWWECAVCPQHFVPFIEGCDPATVAALTAENERQAKAISFAVGWLGAMLERRQYEDAHELREMQGMLAAAQLVEAKEHG